MSKNKGNKDAAKVDATKINGKTIVASVAHIDLEPAKPTLTPVKKALTPIAKADESMKAKQAAAIAEVAAMPKTPIEVPVVAAPVRPEMPANFCMEKADWDGNGVCYDAGSNNCGTCTKDFPETVAVCIERMKFLGGTVKAAKAKKSGTAKARTPKVGGVKPQSIVIDELLTASTGMPEMIAPTAIMGSASSFIIAAGATPFFFSWSMT